MSRSSPSNGSPTFTPMTAKDYCSQVCKAKCCKAHEPIYWPRQCPKLTDDNLCSIYEHRIGFTFRALAMDGSRGACVCSHPKVFLLTLSPEVRAQCCIAHPELLENDEMRDRSGSGTSQENQPTKLQ